jgi:hypothetical protein
MMVIALVMTGPQATNITIMTIIVELVLILVQDTALARYLDTVHTRLQ